MPALLCLGCDEDLGHRAADRRALQGPPAEGIVDAWKAMFENATMQVEIDDDDRLCADATLDLRVEELQAFIGINVAMGMLRLPQIRDYWATDDIISTP